MTRLLAYGDLHLGAGADYGREPGDRLNDQAAVLKQIVGVASHHNVDAVLFAGDMFDGPAERITPEQYAVMIRHLSDLRKLGVPFLAVTGNGRHDAAMRDVKAPEVLGHHASIATRPELNELPGGAVVAALPWVPVSRLVALQDGGDRDRIHEQAAEYLLATARDLAANAAHTGRPSVLLLHWSVSGASTPSGISTDEFREVVLDADQLSALGFDAIVAGHIHKAQAFDPVAGWTMEGQFAERPFFYTGSPLPIDFGEAETPHGVWLLDLEDGHASATFVPVDSRRFVTVDVDLTTERHLEFGCDETDAVAAQIATHLPLDDTVVKVRYRATEEQARRIDWPKLRLLLEPCHKVYSISGDILRSERARVDGLDEGMAPLAAVDAWVCANDLSTDQSAALVDLSTRYLHEVGA